ELSERVDAAVTAGVERDAIVRDPGIGVAKRAEHDWPVLHGLGSLVSLGLPGLVGASRKRVLARWLVDRNGEPRPAERREDATAAVSTLAAAAGAWGVRVHDVGASLDAVTVASAWMAGHE